MKLSLPVVDAMRLMFLWWMMGAPLSVMVGVSAAEEFPQYRWAVPCPSEPSLTGYVSLADLNTEMRRHSSELSPPLSRIPAQEFRYHLCPQSTFNASVPLFLPPALMQFSPVIQCGNRGSSIDTCILAGGANHVLILDSGDAIDGSSTTEIDDRHPQSVVFQGMIFQGSSDISIAAFSNRTNAQFIDCHWKDIQGRAAIMLANAKPLTWPQVPQPTFVLESESHNIFSSRRRRLTSTDATTATSTTTNTTTLTSTNDKVTMQVSCLGCSFQDSGKDDFVLLDSYMKGALMIIIDSTIQSITGAMVINVLHGKLQLVDTSISHCTTSVATVRGQSQSLMDIYNSTLAHNQPAMATFAVVKKSQLQMNATQIQETTAMAAPLLVVVESSHVTVADSCWVVSMDDNTTATTNTAAAVLVDSSSSAHLERTSISLASTTTTTSSSAMEDQQENTATNTTTTSTTQQSNPTADECTAQIWNMEGTMDCFNSNTCVGSCTSVPIQDQCTIPTDIPTWEQVIGSSTPTSGGRYQWGTTLLSCFLSVMILGSQLFDF